MQRINQVLDSIIDRLSSPTVARALVASLFVISGLQSLSNFSNFAGAVAAKNLPYPFFSAIIALLFKLGGGLLLMADLQKNLAILALIVFTLIATILYHNPLFDFNQLTAFLKNIAIIGGLISLLST